MPWSVEDVEAKNQGLTPKQKKAWVAVANSVLEQTGDEGAAIERANGVVKKQTSLKESELDSRLGDRNGATLSEADDEHFYGAWRGGSKASGGGPGRAPTKEGRVKDMAARVGAENVGKDPNQRNKDLAASERAKGVKYATHDANGRRLATPDDYAKDPAAAERIRSTGLGAKVASRADAMKARQERSAEALRKVEAARLRDKAENPFDGESAKQFEARTTLKVQPRAKNASQEYLTRRGPESLSVRPQDLHPDFRQASPAEMTARYGPGWENRSRSQQAAYDAKRSKPASPTAPGSHSDYKAALADAQRRADQSGLPVVIRKGSEFGRPVFNVNYKSNDGSDFRAETVMPNKVREASSDDHFYGAWKGGSAKSGGRPMTKAEEAKPNKGEPERPRLEGVRRDSHTQTDDSMLAHIRMNYGIDSPEYQKARADVMAKNAKPPATKSALEGPEWRTDDARLAHMRMKYGADSKEYQAARAEVMAKNQQGNRTANLSGVPGVRVDRQGNIAGRPRLPAQYGATVAQPGAEQARSDLYSSRLSKAPRSRIIGSVIQPRLATKPTAHQLQLEAEARQRRLARRSAIKEAFEAEVDSRLGDRSGLSLREVATTPDPKALREADDDHFHGPWKGGSAKAGGRPMSPTEQVKAAKDESPKERERALLSALKAHEAKAPNGRDFERREDFQKAQQAWEDESQRIGREIDTVRKAHRSGTGQAPKADFSSFHAKNSDVRPVGGDRPKADFSSFHAKNSDVRPVGSPPSARRADERLTSPDRLTRQKAEFQQAVLAKRDTWVAGAGGTEEPYRHRSGNTIQRVYNPKTGEHGYLDVKSDIVHRDKDLPAWLREADDDHFYGAWTGGSKASGGRPMTASEKAKPNKGEAKPEDNAAANRAKGYPEYWSKADREHHEKVVMPRQERLQAIRDKAERDWAGKTSEERDKAAGELANRAANLQRRYGDKMPDSVSERVLALRSEKEGIDRATRKAEQAEREGRFARGEETAGRVSIKAKSYRGEDGFIVQSVGGGRTSNALRNFGARTESVFVKAKTRKGAEYIRDLIKQGKEVDSAAFARAAEM